MNEKSKLNKDLLLELTQLRESENRWRVIAENSPDHILTLGPDLTIQYVNHPAPGLTKEELVGNSIISFLPEDRQSEVRSILQEVMDTSQAALYETEYLTPDGEVIYFETHAIPRKVDGRIEGLTLSSRDVTKRKLIENKLKQQGDLIQSIFLSAPIGIGMVTDRIILEVNEYLCEMIGYKRDELINQNARILYPTQADFDYVGQVKYAQIGEAGTGAVETRFLRKDGQIIDVLLSSTPLDVDDLSRGVTFSVLEITERNRVREELKTSSLKWQNTFNAVTDAICLLDSEQRIIQSNQAMDEMFPDAGRMIGKYCFEIVHSSTGPVENCPIVRMRQTLKREHMEFQYGDRTLEVTVDPLFDESGALTSAVHSIRDITERIEAREKLLRNQYILTKAQEIGKIGTWELDIQEDILRWTDENYKIFDVPPGTEMNLERFLSLIHPDDLDYVTEKWNAALKNEPYDIEHRIIVKDGVKWVREKADIEFDTGGSPVIAIGFSQDITERKKAEQAVYHSYDLMTYIIEHNRSSVAVHDRDLKYIYVSKRYLEEYNVEDPDIIGKHHYDVFPDLPQKWRDVHQKALAGEISIGDNDPYYRDDGTLDWTRWECRPWYDEEGAIGGIIIYTEVITDYVRAQQEKDMLLAQVREANERLKSLSRELINSQEAERKRISQELHDELGQALTAISLDLGIIEQNLPSETPTEIRDRLTDTKKNADGLDQMIRELALDLRPSLLDDLGLLPTLNWYLEGFSQRTNIDIEIEVNDDSDGNRLPEEIEIALYRIIQEALTNVVKHAEAKKVGLRIEIGAGVVKVHINDDGKGFDSSVLHLPETSPRGLGLLGMADRTALVGGDIRINAKPGKGTRIEVEIPL